MKSDFDLKFQNQNVESKIVAALERISQAFRVLLWQESKEFSLNPIQVQVLIFLLHHSEEKRTVSYLAQEFNITKATLSDTVKSLEEKQLIRKVAHEKDSRSYRIALTAKGTEMATEASMFSKEIKKPIDKLGEEEKAELLFSLLNIIRHLNRAGVLTIQRMCFTCQHYSTGSNGPYCKLLNQPLHSANLRVDCPEHELKV